MSEHKWIIGVFQDLENFAEKNALGSLQVVLREARSKAENEIKAAVSTEREAGEQLSSAWLN